MKQAPRSATSPGGGMRFFSMHEARQMLDEVSLGFTAASSWLPEPEWRRVKGDLEAVIERTISNHFV